MDLQGDFRGEYRLEENAQLEFEWMEQAGGVCFLPLNDDPCPLKWEDHKSSVVETFLRAL